MICIIYIEINAIATWQKRKSQASAIKADLTRVTTSSSTLPQNFQFPLSPKNHQKFSLSQSSNFLNGHYNCVELMEPEEYHKPGRIVSANRNCGLEV